MFLLYPVLNSSKKHQSTTGKLAVTCPRTLQRKLIFIIWSRSCEIVFFVFENCCSLIWCFGSGKRYRSMWRPLHLFLWFRCQTNDIIWSEEACIYVFDQFQLFCCLILTILCSKSWLRRTDNFFLFFQKAPHCKPLVLWMFFEMLSDYEHQRTQNFWIIMIVHKENVNVTWRRRLTVTRAAAGRTRRAVDL